MKKITLFLLSLFCVFSLSVIAQESTPTCDSVSINLFDSWGDGGGSVTFGGVTATNAGESSSALVCVDLSACNQVDYEATDLYPGENSWTITDASGAALAAGGPEDGLLGVCVSGCSDSLAENYNADADIVDDSLCEFAFVQGCMDSTACNYDLAAEQDNGSCEYPEPGRTCEGDCSENHVILFMND
jgi:hypothetical protein